MQSIAKMPGPSETHTIHSNFIQNEVNIFYRYKFKQSFLSQERKSIEIPPSLHNNNNKEIYHLNFSIDFAL